MQKQLRNTFDQVVSPVEDLGFQWHLLSSECVRYRPGSRSLEFEQDCVNIIDLVVHVIEFV